MNSIRRISVIAFCTFASIDVWVPRAVWAARSSDSGESPEADATLSEKATSQPAPLSPEVEALIKQKEGQAANARREGIALLESYLRDARDPGEIAEVLYKLAELAWEEAQARYLEGMGKYEAAVEACKADRNACKDVPRRRPRLDLNLAQGTYRRLVEEFPKFRKIDTVLYLYAFSLREQGKNDEAIGYFQRILKDFPSSRFRADAWMALAEYRFYERRDFKGALAAYNNVNKFPDSPLYGLSLFKSAWCHWKLGQGDLAAARFKDVLDLTESAKNKGEKARKQAAELQDQALEYLVELFIEDDSKSAQDAFDFLVQIGGKAYSERVLGRLADTVYDQTRYERAAEAYLFLLTLAPMGKDAPDRQIRIVECFQSLGKNDRAAAEMRRLATQYAPGSAWAKANADRPKTLERTRARAEEFVRTHVKRLHALAQRNEKESKVVDRELYAQAAEGYAFYLEQFPGAKDTIELRYYRADILFFKLARYKDAGNDYLLVGKSKPVGALHKEALLQAMGSFEKLRPPAPRSLQDKKNRKVTEEDRKFAEAADVYAEILPGDKDIITVIYKNGQFFYDYGDYDEATKRFGLIVEKYPDDPNAGAAGDRLLECLAEAKDYSNIETWARRLKSAKAFASKDDQKRLDTLIFGALNKQAEALAKEKPGEAAVMFERVSKEFPNQEGAAVALYNAGAAYEQAGKLQAAVNAYEGVAERFSKSPRAPESLFVAAKLDESIGDYSGAAGLYEQVAKNYPTWNKHAEATRNAGILRQTLGQYDRAAAHFSAYEQQHKGTAEAGDIAFARASMYEDKGDAKQSAKAFGDFAAAYPKDDRAVESLMKQGRAYMAQRNDRKAKESLDEALGLFKRRKMPKEQSMAAAEARYVQGELLFRDYEAVKIEGGPRQLSKALERKAALLDEAKTVFMDVLSYKIPEWATASLLRIGQGYGLFAKAIRGTKVPSSLSAAEQEVYREELDKFVIVIEDKALSAYRTGYNKALEIGVYNRHTKALREALSDLDNTAFPAAAEVRMGPQVGENTDTPVVMQEIRRD